MTGTLDDITSDQDQHTLRSGHSESPSNNEAAGSREILGRGLRDLFPLQDTPEALVRLILRLGERG